MPDALRSWEGLVGGALLVFVVAHGEPATAVRLTDFSQAELRTLPRLCLAQQFINDELESPVVSESERKKLATEFGHSFIHYHHYCWALLYINRAAQPGGDKYNYRRAVKNFDYVIRNADPSFALLPEVYLDKGKVLEILGERETAVIEYRNALSARANYTPAYAALVQVYLELGDLEAAQTALATGLQHDPRSKVLAEKKAALAKSKKAGR